MYIDALPSANARDAGPGTGYLDARTLQPEAAPLADPAAEMRRRQQRSGQWHGGQMAGRRWPVACVSLQITQRCNDCTLCYLSESTPRISFPALLRAWSPYANRYAAKPAPLDFGVRFTPYDWTVAYPAQPLSLTPRAP